MAKLKYLFNVRRLIDGEEIRDFAPELLINAAGLAQTENAFRAVIPFLPESCIISDIASVKNDLKRFYNGSGFRFVSTHPMFGPTFADIGNLKTQSAIIISESCTEGKTFFRRFYEKLGTRRQSLRSRIRRTRRTDGVLADNAVCCDAGLCLVPETDSGAGNNVQETYGNCRRPALRRRRTFNGNSVKPPRRRPHRSRQNRAGRTLHLG